MELLVKRSFKRIWLTLLAVTVFAAMACVTGISAGAEGNYKVVVDDKIGVLTSEEVQSLTDKANEAAENMSMNIGVVLSENIEGKSPVDYSDDYYDDAFGINTDGVLVLINNDTKVDYISTSGQGILYFDDNTIQKIHDRCQPYLREGDYNGAVEAYLETLQMFYAKGIPDSNSNYMIDENGSYVQKPEGENSYDTGSESSGMSAAGGFLGWISFPILYTNGVILWAALGVGVLAGGIFLLVIYNRYKFKAAPSAGKYLENISHNLWRQRDIYLGTHRSRRKIETDSGGGGSSTHTSSSGGTHGGGGSAR